VCSLARGLPARTLELAGVAAGPHQLTGCQLAGWLIYGASVAMEWGVALGLGLRPSSCRETRRYFVRLGGADSMNAHLLAARMATLAQVALDSDGGVASALDSHG
jgi:hypothetical protein